jgi:type VI secretion system lysozyme-like protein
MAMQRTLLERLRSPDPIGQRRLHVSVTDVQNSILSNLQCLLNTCRGNCLIDPDYGLPHMTEIRSAMPDSIRTFEAAIRAAIERNEPRLVNIRVRHTPHAEHGLELRFEISGLVMDEQERTAMRFETYADEEGRLIVR